MIDQTTDRHYKGR